MKTAIEWEQRLNESLFSPTSKTSPREVIHAALLDYYKAGMTEAAVLCESTGDNVSKKQELTDAECEYQNGAYTCQRIIQQARDAKVSL